MAALFFNGLAGISPTAVPHQGEAPALPQVLGGHIPYMFCSAPTAASVIAANQVKGIAVTSKQRSRILPDTPTMEQAGLPGYEMVNWWGFFGPAGMPKELVDKYNRAFKEILQEPATKAKLETIGFELTGTSPEEFVEYIKAENIKWAKVIQEQGLKPN
jgi:tripartite-type tricarboxylate transporter receptor subunit TctC